MELAYLITPQWILFHSIFKTHCINAKGDYLLYELHKRPGVAVRKMTTFISQGYRMMNTFFYLFKIRKGRSITLRRSWESVAQSALQVWCFILAAAELLCRSGGGSWHHSSEMRDCVDSGHGPAASGSPCTPCSSRELSVLRPWSWSSCLFCPARDWLKMKETVFSSSTLCKEFLKQGKWIGVFAGDYFWIINYL